MFSTVTKIYSVKVFFKEELLSEIFVNSRKVNVVHYSDKILLRPFGVRTDVDYTDLFYFYEERCFPRDRENCDDLLKSLGLDFYLFENICRKTHGQQFDDFVWLQFSDEPQVTYNEIKLRD